MKSQCALALLITASAGVAAAAPEAGPDSLQMQSEAVYYDASAMHEPRAVKKLFFRIRLAAEEVCRMSSHPAGYELWEERTCEADSVALAVRESGIPALEEYYFGSAASVVASNR